MRRLLVSLYPRRWRERYGEELTGLIDDTGMTPAIVADVARGAAGEWAVVARDALNGGTTMTIGPAWRHPTGWAAAGAVLMFPTVGFALVSLLAYNLGVAALVPLRQAALDWLTGVPRIVDLVLLLIPLAAAMVALVPLVRIELRQGDGERQLGVVIRLRWLNIVIGLIGLALSGLLIWNVFAESVLGVG